MLSDEIDILLETDIVNIICTLKERKKEKGLKKKKKSKKDAEDTNRRSEKRELEVKPRVIDNSQETCDNNEYLIPQNKIIRFEEVAHETGDKGVPLRIRKPSFSPRENTNTPTVNIRDETKRRTRRGKRAGKRVNNRNGELEENTKSQQSFLDFIVDNDPEITTNTEALPGFSLMEDTGGASPIKHSKEEDSVEDLGPAVPLLHDVVSCNLLHLDRVSKTPVIGRVKGKVIKYDWIRHIMDSVTGDRIRIYSEDLDDIFEVTIVP